jgi:hypothetical protein
MKITVNKMIAMTECFHYRKFPSDVTAFLNQEYTSESTGLKQRLGDMPLPHFVRVLNKAISEGGVQ